MPDRVFTVRHQRTRVILDSIIVLLLLVAVYQQSQNRDLARKISHQQQAFILEQKRVNNRFAAVLVQGCVASNGARTSLRNLLIAVDVATRRSSNQTPAEKIASHRFYQRQIENIHLTDCSRYGKAAGSNG
jgi:hypothetical protein